MRKQIITMMVSFAALFLFAASVCAAPVSGGWSITDDTSITPEAQEVFDQAMESFTGVGYEPVDLLATQVVAGTNYCFLCRGTVIVPDAAPEYYYVYIYEDLEGNAELLDIQKIAIGEGVFDRVEETETAETAETAAEYDETIRKALELIKDAWQDQADQYPDMISSPYVDIKNTRIIKISDNPVNVQLDDKPVEELEGIDSVIEFMMLTNYFGDTYPCNAGILDTVAVHDDGTMEVLKSNIMNSIRAKYYITDFSGVIDEIVDLEDAYNGALF